MGYRIRATPLRVEIKVDAAGVDQERLLDTFRACRSGSCGCPSGEYRKVGTVSIGITDRHVVVGMSPRPGTRFHTEGMHRRLSHLLTKAEYPRMAASRIRWAQTGGNRPGQCT